VVGQDCLAVPGALVEVWYAGGSPAGYTFPPSSTLWYRGRARVGTDGRYEFLATMPKVYSGRPILHYHYKVVWQDQDRQAPS
jgi:protocatechuate 3,4-dioxygenase beta subunit